MYTYQQSTRIVTAGAETTKYFTSHSGEIQKRFSFLLEQHRDSATNANATELGEINFCAGHYVTRRYAELLASILVLNKEFPSALKHFGIDKEMKPLRVAVSSLLGRLGDLLPDQQEKVLFLINNYDIILSVAAAAAAATTEDAEAKAEAVQDIINSQDTQHFESLLSGMTDKYVNMQLQKHFSGLLQFIKKYSLPDAATGVLQVSAQPQCEPRVIEELLKDFAEDDYWKKQVETINKEIMKSFHNFETGTMVFQKVLSSLYEYYGCLLDIIGLYFKELRGNKYFITKTELTYMMKHFNSFL